MGLALVDAGPPSGLDWRPALPVLLLVGVVVLAWDPGATDVRNTKRFALHGIASAWALFALVDSWRSRTPLALGVPAVVLAWAVLPWLVKSGPAVRLLEQPLYFGFLALAWALAGHSLRDRRSWLPLLWGLTGIAGALSLAALVELVSYGAAPGFRGVVGGHGNPNDLAATLVVLLPAAQTCARGEARLGGPATVVLVSIFGALGATGSHIALLAAAATLGLVAAAPNRAPWVRVVQCVVLVAALSCTWAIRANGDAQRPVVSGGSTPSAAVESASEDTLRRAAEGRLYLLARGAEVVAAEPIRGAGTGEFAWAFALAQANHLEAHPEDVRFHTRLRHAHNDPLELLAEHGLFGLAALALGLYMLRRLSRREPDDEGPQPAFALLGVLYFSMVALLHPALHMPSVALIGVVYLAVAIAPRPVALHSTARRVGIVVGIAVVAIGLAATVRQVRADWATVRGLELVEAGRWSAALDAFDEATTRHPSAEALFHKGRVLLELGQDEAAVEVLEAAAWLAPVPEIQVNLGLARCRTGDFEGGSRSIELAQRLDPSEASGWQAFVGACEAGLAAE